MRGVARHGDRTSHSGTVSGGSARLVADGRAAVRVGDGHDCPLHGPNAVTSGSPVLMDDDKAVATIGSNTTCGATIVSGSVVLFAEEG